MRADLSVSIDHVSNDRLDAAAIPSPTQRNNLAIPAKFYLVAGSADPNGADLDVLHDGRLADQDDEPDANFFFNPASNGGRIGIDLGRVCNVKQVRTYSRHPDVRAPQVYTLWGADGLAREFKLAPAENVDPQSCGWRKIAAVDTHQKFGTAGGEYVATISNPAVLLGSFRYLLMVIAKATPDNVDGNTFYSELEVLDDQPAELISPLHDGSIRLGVKRLVIDHGRYTADIDTADAPELRQWAESDVARVVAQWYPALVRMLPSDGYIAPAHFTITFRKKMEGVAYTVGTRVNCAASFFDHEMHGQDLGAIVHEMVHVVQQYGRRSAAVPYPAPGPVYFVEGLADYIRWYDFEPQAHGAEVSRHGIAEASYTGSYRITANFLHYVTTRYDDHLIVRLNDVMRQGVYADSFWQTETGKTLAELNDDWKRDLAMHLQAH